MVFVMVGITPHTAVGKGISWCRRKSYTKQETIRCAHIGRLQIVSVVQLHTRCTQLHTCGVPLAAPLHSTHAVTSRSQTQEPARKSNTNHVSHNRPPWRLLPGGCCVAGARRSRRVAAAGLCWLHARLAATVPRRDDVEITRAHGCMLIRSTAGRAARGATRRRSRAPPRRTP